MPWPRRVSGAWCGWPSDPRDPAGRTSVGDRERAGRAIAVGRARRGRVPCDARLCGRGPERRIAIRGGISAASPAATRTTATTNATGRPLRPPRYYWRIVVRPSSSHTPSTGTNPYRRRPRPSSVRPCRSRAGRTAVPWSRTDPDSHRTLRRSPARRGSREIRRAVSARGPGGSGCRKGCARRSSPSSCRRTTIAVFRRGRARGPWSIWRCPLPPRRSPTSPACRRREHCRPSRLCARRSRRDRRRTAALPCPPPCSPCPTDRSSR
mmetsp:Transcript_8802/g.21370  ORF Transcript_8802/g.21370 Transcript_8802/m.21370 type:complete len:266 (-) Transcript_8802:1651-2448(-)